MELISLILSAVLDTVQDVAPLVAALGLGRAANVPGRSPLIDGFGLIAFASVFPIIAVLGYAQLSSALESAQKRRRRRGSA